jgi:hypothetical protein
MRDGASPLWSIRSDLVNGGPRGERQHTEFG